ncbi:MAG: glucose 1-dehydrogenase [Candidatus Peregrinibacteria bacterium]
MKNKSVLSLFDLSGKVAIVTGGNRGLGKAMAMALAQAGAHVVIAGILDVDASAKSLGGKAMGVQVDVTQKKQIDAMVKKVLAKFGRIDILVNNAGVYCPTPVQTMKEQDWDKIMNVNLKGSLLCAQAVGRHMVQCKSGNIINVASIAGLMAFASSAAYNASKAALIMLTKTLATEWAPYHVRVNAICPGIFATDMTQGLLKDKGFQGMINTKVPLGRYGMPEELMGAALYLASDASSYTTGHALVVDGGWTVGL